jgi:hypothetical protein
MLRIRSYKNLFFQQDFFAFSLNISFGLTFNILFIVKVLGFAPHSSIQETPIQREILLFFDLVLWMFSLAFALLCFLTNTELVVAADSELVVAVDSELVVAADTQVDCTRNNNTTIIAAAASRKQENKHDLVESSSGIASSHQTTLESLPKASDDAHGKECASIVIDSNLSQNPPLSLSTFNPNDGIIMEPRNDDCTSECLDDPNNSQNSVKKLENVQKKNESLPSKYPFLSAQDLPPPLTSRPLDSFTRYEVLS